MFLWQSTEGKENFCPQPSYEPVCFEIEWSMRLFLG